MTIAGLFIGAISALFLLPGYALVQTLHVWREESLLSRLLLSAGVGAAIYPVLFYASVKVSLFVYIFSVV